MRQPVQVLKPVAPDTQFWWNWWVYFGTALATFLAVLVALFKDWFLATFFPPELEVRLVDRRGAPPVTASITVPGQNPFETVSRWYHVEVSNKRRASRAIATQVCLVAVEEPNAADQFVRRLTGSIPLQVRHQGIVRPGRIIGSPVQYDLCSVLRDSLGGGGPIFALHTVVAPNDITVQTNQRFRIAYILQAQSIEMDSKLLRVEIAWDGKWSDDTTEMANYHLVMNSAVLADDLYSRAPQ
jgi:hypothetical protein